jgi:hypothetical protein
VSFLQDSIDEADDELLFFARELYDLFEANLGGAHWRQEFSKVSF